MSPETLKRLSAAIEKLEARVTYLENKPPAYVPPPTYGPLSVDEGFDIGDKLKGLDFTKLKYRLRIT